MKYRKTKLKQYKRGWFDRETHTYLKILKRQMKKSMMQIVKDLVYAQYQIITNKNCKKSIKDTTK